MIFKDRISTLSVSNLLGFFKKFRFSIASQVTENLIFQERFLNEILLKHLIEQTT